MVALAGALVLNIGTLSPHWVDAMILAGKAANEHGIPVVLDPVGAGATRYRTETARRLLDEVKVAVLRANQGEVATLVGVEAEVRGVESIGAGASPPTLRAPRLATSDSLPSVTGPVDHVSDGERVLAVANGHELLAAVTGTGCMSSAITGCFLAVARDRPLEAAAAALAAFGIAGEDAARDAKGPGSFHVGLYDALAGARARDARRRARGSREAARPRGRAGDRAARGRRRRDGRAMASEERAACGRRRARPRHAQPLRTPRRHLRRERRHRGCAHARRRRRASRPHRRGGRAREGSRAPARALRVEPSRRRAHADGEADYIGVGPVWETPSKADADPAIGLDGLREICAATIGSRRRDRRHRRGERRGLHSRRTPPALRSFARRAMRRS